MVILNYFFYFQCFLFHAHVLTSFLLLLDVAWLNKIIIIKIIIIIRDFYHLSFVSYHLQVALNNALITLFSVLLRKLK